MSGDANPAALKQRLQAVLQAYHDALDAGQEPDRAELLRQNPEIAPELEAFFQSEDELDRLASLRPKLQLQAEAPARTRPDAALAPLPPPAVQPPLAAGLNLGGYVLDEEIGRGRSGIVYKARQNSRQRTVALKVLHPGIDAATARREAEAAANLDHPHVIPVYEAGEQDGYVYVSMPLAEGQPLAHVLDQLREDLPGAARLLAQAARAVHYAHQRAVIHRNLSPRKILVTEDQEPLLLGFGPARKLRGPADLLRPGGGNTPLYLAPEQLRGDKWLTTTADVYALGAILYEILTGQPPYAAADARDLRQQLEERALLLPQAVNPRVDPDLESVCLACLERKPSRRYGSAEALAEDLERWVRGEPVSRQELTAAGRLRLWLRRNGKWAGLAAAGVVFLVLVTLGALFTATSAGLRSAQDRQAAEQERLLRADAERARQKAEEGRDRAAQSLARSEGRRLAAQADAARADNPGLALLLALEAAKRQPGLQAHNALVAALESCHEQRVLAGHGDEVRDVAFSPDGRRAVTASADRTARVWDAATGALVRTLTGHTAAVLAARFSPDGRRVLTLAADHTVRIWEVNSGRSLVAARDAEAAAGTEPDPGAASFSPDGRHVVTALGALRIHDVLTGKEPFSLAGQSRVSCAAFRPDGRRLVSGSRGGSVCLWDLASGELVQSLTARGEVRAVVFSPDGNQVLVVAAGSAPGQDEVGRLWHLDTGREAVLRRPAPRRAVAAAPPALSRAAFSADGRRIVTVHRAADPGQGQDVWDAATGRHLFSLRADDALGPDVAAAFSPKGSLVAAAGLDRTVGIWDVESGKESAVLRGHADGVTALAFSPDGQRLATAGRDRTVRLWEVPVDRDVVRRRGRWSEGRLAVPTPDGRRLLTHAPDDPTRAGLVLWDVDAVKELVRYQGQEAAVVAARFSPDGRRLATQAADQTIRVWDAANGTALALFKAPRPGPVALDFSADGTRLAVAQETLVVVWDVPGNREALRLEAPRPQVYLLRSARFSPDGRHLVTSAWAEEAGPPRPGFTPESLWPRLWDAATGREVLAFRRDTDPDGLHAAGAQFSPDGRVVLTHHPAGPARLWETATGKELAALDNFPGTAVPPAFSPDGKQVAVALDRLVGVWDAATGKQLQAPRGPEEPVRALAFSPDGKGLLTLGHNGIARIWEVKSGKEWLTLRGPEGAPRSGAYTHDGQRVVLLTGDGAARYWPVQPVAAAEPRKPRDLTPAERERYDVPGP